MTAPGELPVLLCADAAAWERWLEEHHAAAPGVWLRLAKKGAPEPTVSYVEAVEVALCWGWIDGQSASLDATHYLQRFTHRTARSPWSQVNRERVGRLVEAGRMRPEGLAEVQRAQADGRWERAYPPPSTATVPDDLQAALNAAPGAAAAWAALSASDRFSVLHRVHEAKRPETRARRIEKYVGMLVRGEGLRP